MKQFRPWVTVFDLPLVPLQNTVPIFSHTRTHAPGVSLTGNEARVQFVSGWRSQYLGGKRTWVCLTEYRTLWMDTQSVQVYSSNWDRQSFKSPLSVQKNINSTACRRPSYVWPDLISTEYVKRSKISALLPDACTEHHHGTQQDTTSIQDIINKPSGFISSSNISRIIFNGTTVQYVLNRKHSTCKRFSVYVCEVWHIIFNTDNPKSVISSC